MMIRLPVLILLSLPPTPALGPGGPLEGPDSGFLIRSVDTIPSDTYADEGARALIRRAMEARAREEEEIDSYEGVLRERMYLGFAGLSFRRERSILQSERVARIRWSRRDGKEIQWVGDRTEVPILGPGASLTMSRGSNDSEGTITLGMREGERTDEVKEGIQASIVENLNPLIFSFRPGDDRLVFGSQFALHPLADTAAFYYRYRSGDTLTIHLPTENRAVTLREVLVEPREARFRLLAGSLWFDEDTGTLARATFRPGRAYDVEVDGGEDVPGILSPFQVGFDYFTMEYSLQEFRWWLPRRLGVKGEIRAGGILRIPLAAEWSITDYLVNTDDTRIPSSEALPEGWKEGVGTVEEEGHPPEAVRVVVPPTDSLWHSPSLTGEMLGPTPVAFTDAEIDELMGELSELIPGYDLYRPRWAWGLTDRNLRYNRVEGVSLGASADIPLSARYSVEPRFRFGLLDQEPRGSLSLHRGPEEHRLSLTAYRRLAHTSDFGDPLSLGASISNLVFRNGLTHFYQATGGDLELRRNGRRTRVDLRLFHEEQDPVRRETNFYLWRPFTGDTLPLNLPAEAGTVTGVAGDLRWQWGVDPARGVFSGLLRGEAATGDSSYQRGLATVAFSRPLLLGTALAVELGGGGGWGVIPIQKEFFLGGSTTLRGYPGSFTAGESFWMARGELGTSLPVARLAFFSDLGWAGPKDAWGKEKALWSLGGGLSFLDGLLRMDFAWPMREVSGMRFYLYMDGLF